MDFNGPGIYDVESVASWQDCKTICKDDLKCSHFVYGKKPGQPYTNVCHLKYNSNSEMIPNDCCISGPADCIDMEVKGKNIYEVVETINKDVSQRKNDA